MSKKIPKTKRFWERHLVMAFIAGLFISYMFGIVVRGAIGSNVTLSAALLVLLVSLAIYDVIGIAILKNSIAENRKDYESFGIGFLGIIIGLIALSLLKRIKSNAPLWKVFVVGFVIYVLLAGTVFLISFLLYGNSIGNMVHITGIYYHYYDPQTGHAWTYSVPIQINLTEGSTSNATFPFTSNLTCSLTISDVYATTPGFEFILNGIPITVQPYQTVNITMSIIAPSFNYTGPLNVNETVTYGSGCA